MAMILNAYRPALLYRAHCQRCRVLSLLIWLAGLGALRRVPLLSHTADKIVGQFGSKLLLASSNQVLSSWHAARLATALILPRWIILTFVFGVIQ